MSSSIQRAYSRDRFLNCGVEFAAIPHQFLKSRNTDRWHGAEAIFAFDRNDYLGAQGNSVIEQQLKLVSMFFCPLDIWYA